MSTVKEVTASYGVTINTGNYESERVDMSCTLTLAPNDDPDSVLEGTLLWLKEKVATEKKAIKEKATRIRR